MLIIRFNKFIIGALLTCSLLFLISCSQQVHIDKKYVAPDDVKRGILSATTIALNASSPRLNMESGIVITDNDAAFRERLRIVQNASHTLDLGYYIYQDDISSSRFSKALIEAAQRGVRVRLLLDYRSVYPDLDLFSMLERYGNQGSGSLEVRFYNRPSINIIKDAIYLTLGCAAVGKENDLKSCSGEKYRDIEARITASQDPLNLNSGGSGLFLSAFYSSDIQQMALAIQEGQQIVNPFLQNKETTTGKVKEQDVDKLIKLGKIYFTARHGKGFSKLAASLKLKLAFAFFGGEINPYYDAFTAYLPVGRDAPRIEALRDWDYVTDFFHQKLILADNKSLMIGGRNIEDVYHLQENTLIKNHQFMDTDARLTLKEADASLANIFQRLWNFHEMVATENDIRQHAPNDFITAKKKADDMCDIHIGESAARQQCREKILRRYLSTDYRIELAYQDMLKNTAIYQHKYQPQKQSNWPRFAIDREADVYYVENIPFEKDQTNLRHYGAKNGREGRSGKYIHNLWLTALRNTCHTASAEHSKQIIIHSAYVFMPSNLFRQLSDMLSGKQACRHVNINILTNSIKTTDLGIENIAANYNLKALMQHVNSNRDPKRAATLSYYHYQPFKMPHGIKPSLHSKVMMLGDDLFIGSANADVRSYMMDANNGLFIRNAPELLKRYSAWVDTLIADKNRVKNLTNQLGDIPLQQMLEEDSKELMQKAISAVSNNDSVALSAELQEKLQQRLKTVLQKIYTLTLQSLRDSKKGLEAQQQFNTLFKLI